MDLDAIVIPGTYEGGLTVVDRPVHPPIFPEALDSSIIGTWKACRHKGFREYFENWKPKGKNVHLHAGGAFAAAMEATRTAFYVDGESSEDSVARGIGRLFEFYGDFECPPDSAKSAERMAGALEFYFASYPLGADGADPITLPSGKKGIEIGFVEPLPITHPETGNPILYCGRLDMAAHYAGGIFVEDDKTTSQLGATWCKQWDLRSQFTGYCWGLDKAAGIKVNGVLVRGVSILKTKYDTQEAISYRTKWQIEEWYEQLLDVVEEMVKCWNEKKYRKNLDHACSDFGGCSFRQPCMSETPLPWLQTNFEQRVWNPVTREETLL